MNVADSIEVTLMMSWDDCTAGRSAQDWLYPVMTPVNICQAALHEYPLVCCDLWRVRVGSRSFRRSSPGWWLVAFAFSAVREGLLGVWGFFGLGFIPPLVRLATGPNCVWRCSSSMLAQLSCMRWLTAVQGGDFSGWMLTRLHNAISFHPFCALLGCTDLFPRRHTSRDRHRWFCHCATA